MPARDGQIPDIIVEAERRRSGIGSDEGPPGEPIRIMD
jgi:hypothetical protein